MKKVIGWLIVIIVILMVVNAPTASANFVDRVFASLSRAGSSLGQFLGSLG